MRYIHWKIMLAVAVVLAGLAACTSATAYSTQLKNEKKLIADYIKRNHITIIYEEPAYDKWQPNEYLEVGDYCYFNLTKMGDTMTDSIETGDVIEMRYRKYTLDVNSDTISYWSTNEVSHPIEFQYNVSSTSSCSGWHYALKYMRYSGAEGKLICPSKLGFTEDGNSVTPYGYDLKFKVRRF